jgi:high-affinity K+ transport system ATPase subunit B
MKFIIMQLKETLHNLFPTRKLRVILLSLVLIAAFISVSELAVAKLFTKIILNEATYSTQELVLLVGFFFIFFASVGQEVGVDSSSYFCSTIFAFAYDYLLFLR